MSAGAIGSSAQQRINSREASGSGEAVRDELPNAVGSAAKEVGRRSGNHLIQRLPPKPEDNCVRVETRDADITVCPKPRSTSFFESLRPLTGGGGGISGSLGGGSSSGGVGRPRVNKEE